MTVERKREAVVFLKTKEVSERRSCQLILPARSTCQYTIKRQPDEEFENQIKELAFANPRYGYRRIHALLRRCGQIVISKRLILNRAVRGRTGKAKVLTVNSETNVCQWKSSATGARLKLFRRNGASSTTWSHRTEVLVIKRRTSSDGTGKSGRDY